MTSGFDTAFEGATTYSAEARFKTKFFGLTGHQLLGVGYSTADFASLEAISDVQLRRFVGNRATPYGGLFRKSLCLNTLANSFDLEKSESWNVYYNFDQYFLQDSQDPTQGLGIFGRFGAADAETNPIAYFYSLGFAERG